MKKISRTLGGAILLAALSGCVVGPSPYYGGNAPYYGTTLVPTYAYGYTTYNEVGRYYPPHRAVNVYSNYNRNYWHYQHNAQAHGPNPNHSPAPEHKGQGSAHDDRQHR